MSIFTHIVIGSNDIDKSIKFYNQVLSPLGIQPISFGEPNGPVTSQMYGKDAPALAITKPINGKPATYANGGTIGLAAENPAAVDAFHAAALANGGSCEGAPGPRPAGGPTAYGAYIRDPDGNKLCAFSYS